MSLSASRRYKSTLRSRHSTRRWSTRPSRVRGGWRSDRQANGKSRKGNRLASNHSLFAQAREVVVSEAEQALQHLVGVLAERRAEAVDTARRFRQARNDVGEDHRLALVADIEGDEIAARVKLPVAEDVGNVVERSGRRVVGVAALQQVGAAQRTAPVAHDLVDVAAVVEARSLLAVEAGRGQLRPTHGFGEAGEHLVGGAGDRHPLAVLGREVAVGAAALDVWAVPLADRPVHGVSRRQLVGAAEDGFVQRGIDVLAAAGLLLVAQRYEYADAAVEAAHIVAERRRAGCNRGAPRHASEIRETAHCVRDPRETRPVLIRPGLTVAGDAQHDQTGVDRPQHLPADAPLLQRAGAEVLAQDIGLLDQSLEQLDPLLAMQVDGHGFLVAPLGEPGERVAAAGRRAEPPAGVAADRVLDLEYLGAEFAEDRRAVGSGDHRRHVDHANARERQACAVRLIHLATSGAARRQTILCWRSEAISAAESSSSSRITS